MNTGLRWKGKWNIERNEIIAVWLEMTQGRRETGVKWDWRASQEIDHGGGGIRRHC